MEFLKANGIEDPGLMKEIDYQDVLNQQEIYGEELNLFANKEKHKEVSRRQQRYLHVSWTFKFLHAYIPKVAHTIGTSVYTLNSIDQSPIVNRLNVN